MPQLDAVIKSVVLVLNWAVNGLAGFFIFAMAFTDQGFMSRALLLMFFGGPILGLISGALLTRFNLLEVVLAMLPLIAFLGLLVVGSVAKGNAPGTAQTTVLLLVSLAGESGGRYVGASYGRRSTMSP